MASGDDPYAPPAVDVRVASEEAGPNWRLEFRVSTMLLLSIPLLYGMGILVLLAGHPVPESLPSSFAGVVMSRTPTLLAPLAMLTALGYFVRSLVRGKPNIQFVAEAVIALAVLLFGPRFA